MIDKDLVVTLVLIGILILVAIAIAVVTTVRPMRIDDTQIVIPITYVK